MFEKKFGVFFNGAQCILFFVVKRSRGPSRDVAGQLWPAGHRLRIPDLHPFLHACI